MTTKLTLEDIAYGIGRTTMFSRSYARIELQRFVEAGVDLALAERAVRLGITVDLIRIFKPEFGMTDNESTT